MKTLYELSIEAALATPESRARAFDFAERFTDHFESTAGMDPALREAALLAVQFPACLRPPQPGDLLVGRTHLELTGISPEAGGLGYYCLRGALDEWVASGDGSPAERARALRISGRWTSYDANEAVRRTWPSRAGAELPSDRWLCEPGVAFPLYRMAGTVLDYATLLEIGIPGLRARILERSRRQDRRARAFLEASLSALDVFASSLDWAASVAPDERSRSALEAVSGAAPSTFFEAVQLLWLYALHSGTWNYGRVDDVLGPFLVRDLRAGRITRAEALDVMCSWWRLIAGYANQFNNRLIIGGLGRRHVAEADEFALLAIEATRTERLNQPQVTLRFHDGQDPRLWEAGLQAISEGCTFPMLYNDDVNVPAVARAFGVSREVAAGYTPYGCGEYTLGPGAQGSPNGLINLLKALEVTLHGGADPATGTRMAAGVPPLESFRSFEDVWNAYARVVEAKIGALADAQAAEYAWVGRQLPFLYLSALTPDCIERGRGLFDGGTRYLGGTVETYGNVNTADSLHVIEELVFRKRECSLADLVSAMDADFAGCEDLRARCLAVAKYGNDEATADAMVARVHEHVCRTARLQAARVGLHSYLAVIINNWANTQLGWYTGASADGRRSGQPMANANNPAPGADRNGPTAFLNSIARLDPGLHAGAVQNMKFSKEWFTGSRFKTFEALLRVYFANGGTQAMITVVSRHDLEAAMREPENWGHLMVRLGGFSIRFVDLPVEGQLEVLARTLH